MEFFKPLIREFGTRHRDTIVEYLAGRLDVRNTVHTQKVFAHPFLENRQLDKGCRELDRLICNFPSLLENVNRMQSRGFRR